VEDELQAPDPRIVPRSLDRRLPLPIEDTVVVAPPNPIGGALCRVLLHAEKFPNHRANMTLVTALLNSFGFSGNGMCC
jgi:hypothetical protein